MRLPLITEKNCDDEIFLETLCKKILNIFEKIDWFYKKSLQYKKLQTGVFVMKISFPHYSVVAEILQKKELNKKNGDEVEKKLNQSKSSSAGKLLGEIIAEFVFKDPEMITREFAKIKEENEIYNLKIKKSFFQNRKIETSIFDDYPREYDFADEKCFDNLMNDILVEGGKYNNEFSSEAIKYSLSFYGIDLLICRITENEYLEIEFKILPKLPSLYKTDNVSSSDCTVKGEDFDNAIEQPFNIKIINAISNITYLLSELKSCLGFEN